MGENTSEGEKEEVIIFPWQIFHFGQFLLVIGGERKGNFVSVEVLCNR